MSSKPIVSMNKVAEQIVEQHGSANDMAKVYRELRHLVENGIVQLEGVEVYRQEASRGNHKYTYHFSDCERTIEIWQNYYLKGEAYSRILIHKVVNFARTADGRATVFPKRLLTELERYLKDSE